MTAPYDFEEVYPFELDITLAGTPVEVTFPETVDVIQIADADMDIFVHESDVSSGNAGAGDTETASADGRLFVQAGATVSFPRRWSALTVVDVNSATGKIYGAGWKL